MPGLQSSALAYTSRCCGHVASCNGRLIFCGGHGGCNNGCLSHTVQTGNLLLARVL